MTYNNLYKIKMKKYNNYNNKYLINKNYIYK